MKCLFLLRQTIKAYPENALYVVEESYNNRSLAIDALRKVLCLSVGSLLTKIELLELCENEIDYHTLCCYCIDSLSYPSVFGLWK